MVLVDGGTRAVVAIESCVTVLLTDLEPDTGSDLSLVDIESRVSCDTRGLVGETLDGANHVTRTSPRPTVRRLDPGRTRREVSRTQVLVLVPRTIPVGASRSDEGEP